MAFKCNTCNVDVSSRVVLEQHLKGKRHKQLAKQEQYRTSQAEVSIFVRGFPTSVVESNLTAHFSHYGPVHQVFINREKGIYALVEFKSKEAAAMAIKQARGHRLQGRELIVRPRQVKLVPPKPASKLKSKSAHEEEPEDLGGEELRISLRSATSISLQMSVLQTWLELSQEDLDERSRIQTALHQAFAHVIEGVELHQFGSSVNGFGTKGADMDLFLDLNLDRHRADGQALTPADPQALTPADHSASTLNDRSASTLNDCSASTPADHSASTPDDRSASTPDDRSASTPGKPRPPLDLNISLKGLGSLKVVDGLVTSESLCESKIRVRMKLLCRILNSAIVGGDQILPIFTARCPVIKFIHKPSQMHCDLTMNNRLALQNTKLLCHLCKLDARLRPLMITVRYWAKRYLVAGNVNSGPRLNNYALCWLVIFYLQQCDPMVLPSVSKLAQQADKEEQAIIDGWDCGFATDTHKVASSDNEASLGELLGGFFVFYSNVDFTKVVICPREGRMVPVAEFQQTISSDDRVAGFKLSAINIQDPFVLDHNVASNVNVKTKVLITEEFTEAAAKCECLQWSTPGTDHEWGISFLLFHPPITKTKSVDPNSSTGFNFTFHLPFYAVSLPKEVCARAGSPTEVKNCWCSAVRSLFLATFRDILLFECQVTQNDTPKEQTKGEIDTKSKAEKLKVSSPESETGCSFTESSWGQRALPGTSESGKRVSSSDNDGQTLKRTRRDSPHQPEDAESFRGKALACEAVSVEECPSPDQDLQKTSENAYKIEESQVELVSASVGEPRSDSETVSGGTQSGSVSDKPPSELDSKNIGAVVLLEMQCETPYNMWAGRKKARKTVCLEDVVVNDGFDLELRITKELEKNIQRTQENDSAFSCDVRLLVEQQAGTDGISVQCRPTLKPKVFQDFFQFFRTFFVKLVDKSLFTTFKEC